MTITWVLSERKRSSSNTIARLARPSVTVPNNHGAHVHLRLVLSVMFGPGVKARIEKQGVQIVTLATRGESGQTSLSESIQEKH